MICDDTLNELKLGKDIRDMTDKEFAEFLQNVEEKDELPKKYYLV